MPMSYAGFSKKKTGGNRQNKVKGQKSSDPFSNMSLEEMMEQDMGEKLQKMMEGSKLDRQMDAHFDEMMSRGLTEDDIMREMLGGKANQDSLEKGNGIEIEPSKMNVNPELFALFDQHMKEKGADGELD